MCQAQVVTGFIRSGMHGVEVRLSQITEAGVVSEIHMDEVLG